MCSRERRDESPLADSRRGDFPLVGRRAARDSRRLRTEQVSVPPPIVKVDAVMETAARGRGWVSGLMLSDLTPALFRADVSLAV